MRALADRLDRRLGGAHQLGDLAVRQFRVELDQPQDRIRAVLAFRQRGGVARTAAFFLAHGGGVELQLQLVQRVRLGLVDLFLGQLVVGDGGVEPPLYAGGHVAIGNALNFQLVQPAEIGDLFEGNGRVVHQPDGGGFCHDRFVVSHRPNSLYIHLPPHAPPAGGAAPPAIWPVGRVSVVGGELEAYIVRGSKKGGKSKCVGCWFW